MSTDLGFTVILEGDFADVEAKTREALMAEGFGVLTEIDVQATFRKKLDVDFRPYKILGACNPVLANRAVTAELEIGLLLPCNVIVYVNDDGKTVVSIVDPEIMLGVVGNAELNDIALEAKERLEKALAAI